MYPPQEAQRKLEEFHEMQRCNRERRQGREKKTPQSVQDSVNQHASQQIAEGVSNITTPVPIRHEPEPCHPLEVDLSVQSREAHQDNVNQHVNRSVIEGASNLATPVAREVTRELSLVGNDQEAHSVQEAMIIMATGFSRDHMVDLQQRASTRAEERSAFRAFVREKEDNVMPEEDGYMELANRVLENPSQGDDSEYLRVARRQVYVPPTSAVMLGLDQEPLLGESSPQSREQLDQENASRERLEAFVVHRENVQRVVRAGRNSSREEPRGLLVTRAPPPPTEPPPVLSTATPYIAPPLRDRALKNQEGPRMCRGDGQKPLKSMIPPKLVPPNHSSSDSTSIPPNKMYARPKYVRQAPYLPRLYSSDNAPVIPKDTPVKASNKQKKKNKRAQGAKVLPPVEDTRTRNGLRSGLHSTSTGPLIIDPSPCYAPSWADEMDQGLSPE